VLSSITSSFAAGATALEELLAVATTQPQQVAEDHRQGPVEDLVEHDGVCRPPVSRS
jgi:hypothetical protein